MKNITKKQKIVLIIFAVIILWTLAFIVVDLGDEKEPKAKKAKK